MQPTTKNLITAVEAERMKRQMSDRRFSREVLGISPSYYCLLKSGKRAITLDVLQIFMQKLPEVTPEVTIYFMHRGNDGDNEKRGQEIINPDNSEKALTKTGVEKPSDYLGHGKHQKTPNYPSKNATRGQL